MTEAERVVCVANRVVDRLQAGARMGREIHADEVRDMVAAYVVMRGLVAAIYER